MAWTLDKIKDEVRIITGIYKDDISDAKVEETIQHFWTVSLPAIIKPEYYKDTYRFLTQKGVSTYKTPDSFTSLSPDALIENLYIKTTFDKGLFSYAEGSWQTESQLAGAQQNQSYVIKLSKHPIPETICVFTKDNTYFYGNKELFYSPNINSVLLTTDAQIQPTEEINIKYQSTSLSRPRLMLITDKYLTLSPIPDGPYVIEIIGMKKPEPLPYEDELDIPQEFCDLIVYGSALKIFSLVDPSGYDKIYPIYKRYESVAMAKTYQNLMYTTVRGI